jgi:hypothetical protein
VHNPDGNADPPETLALPMLRDRAIVPGQTRDMLVVQDQNMLSIES